MGSLPWWKYHYKYMPNAEGDGLFQERISELREDREFDRVVAHYNRGDILAIERHIKEHTVVHFDSPSEVRVHPDTYYAKYSWPQTYPPAKLDGDVSEDVRILGKRGADVVAEVDPHLTSYNLLMNKLYEECHRLGYTIKRIHKLTDTDSTKLLEMCDATAKRCLCINRMVIEDHIQDNPEDTASDIINILETRRAATVRRVKLFKAKANEYITSTIDGYVHCPQREEILNAYHETESKLMLAPVRSFITIAKEEHPDFWANSYSWAFSCSKQGIAKMYRIAWAININGFSDIKSAIWPYPIESIEDFVVIAYRLMTRKNRTSYLSFTQRINGYDNLFKAALSLSGLLGSVYSAYRSCKYVEESGVAGIYEDYDDFVGKSIDGPQIGNKPVAQYVADSISTISDRGNKLIHEMQTLDKEYTISRYARFISGKSATLSAEISPLDYESGIQNAIQLIQASEHCRDEENRNKRIAFTKFLITDETKDDGIGLCLVLKVMKSYVGSIELAENGHQTSISGNAHEKLYRIIREKEFGEEFRIGGLIFWNTEKTPMFLQQAQKAYYLK